MVVPWCASITENGMLKAPQAGDTNALPKVTLECMLKSDTCCPGLMKKWQNTKHKVCRFSSTYNSKAINKATHF